MREGPVVVAVGIQKGGVGKTSLSISLAGAWAKQGIRVGIADFDFQLNATKALLTPKQLGGPTVFDSMIEGVAMDEVGRPAAFVEGITVYPGTPLSERWEDLLRRHSRDILFRKAQEAYFEVAPENIDVLIIDTPPSIGVALQFALSAANAVLIPTKPERLAVEGFGQFLETTQWIRDHVNPELRLAGIVINQVNEQTVEHRFWIDELRKRFGPEVLTPFVPYRIAIAESQSRMVPIEFYREAPSDVKETIRALAAAIGERLMLPQPVSAEAH